MHPRVERREVFAAKKGEPKVQDQRRCCRTLATSAVQLARRSTPSTRGNRIHRFVIQNPNFPKLEAHGMRTKELLLIGALILPQFVSAQNAGNARIPADAFLPPTYVTLGSFASNAKLYFECQGTRPFNRLKCQFTTLSIRTMSATERDKQRASLSEIDKATPNEIATLKNSMAEARGPTFAQLLSRSTPEQAGYLKDFRDASAYIVNAKDKSELKAAISRLNELEERTCKIRFWNWEAEFERAGKHKWISNPGPEGLCNVVRVRVLENREGYENLWTLTETMLSIDADASQTFCSDAEVNKPTVYSWDAPKTIKPDCRYLDVGGGYL
jgi:hypothetical protein